jgi:hypothetical protein
MHEHKWQLKKAEYQKTKHWEGCNSEAVVRRSFKRLLLEKRGHCCETCGQHQWCGEPIPLVLDHIDGNSDNNIESNFQLVCCNCDAQLPTYKNRNYGNGRQSRRSLP